jgi:hypothetical protein
MVVEIADWLKILENVNSKKKSSILCTAEKWLAGIHRPPFLVEKWLAG